MKKLKLNLDEIKVESFEIPDEGKKKGTILGALDHCDTGGYGSCGDGGGTGGGVGTLVASCQTVMCSCNTCGEYTCWLGVGNCGETNTCGQLTIPKTECGYSYCCTQPAYDQGCNWWYPSNACF